jgi:hypothetical protein
MTRAREPLRARGIDPRRWRHNRRVRALLVGVLAAANPDVTCWPPRITSVRFRQPGRIDVALGGGHQEQTGRRSLVVQT